MEILIAIAGLALGYPIGRAGWFVLILILDGD